MNISLTDSEIPKETLQEFLETQLTLEEINDILSIKQHHVNVSKYRINIWSKRLEEGQLIPSSFISHSFYVEYDNPDDGVINETKVSQEEK
jgi:hypothetical protein